MLRDLTAARVICRTHRDFVRLSPHFYNTEDEVDRVLEVLAPRPHDRQAREVVRFLTAVR